MFNLFKSRHAKTISRDLPEHVIFEGRIVHIERADYRRKLTLCVAVNDRIRVRVAKSTSKTEILSLLKEQADWIQKRLEKNLQFRKLYPKKLYVEGEKFLLLGRDYRLRFEESPTAHGNIFARDKEIVVGIPRGKMQNFRPNEPHPELKKPIRDFYKRLGCHIIERKVGVYSLKMDLSYTNISFRSQKSVWGSCTSKRSLSFNWKLIAFSQEVIDYVIVHELAHLEHMNHSKKFWDLVATQIPNYRECRRWLNKNLFETDFLTQKSELYGE